MYVYANLHKYAKKNAKETSAQTLANHWWQFGAVVKWLFQRCTNSEVKLQMIQTSSFIASQAAECKRLIPINRRENINERNQLARKKWFENNEHYEEVQLKLMTAASGIWSK